MEFPSHTTSSDSFRIKIAGLPKFYGVNQVKKLLRRLLGSNFAFRKIKTVSGMATYVSFTNENDVAKAIATLGEAYVRKTKLIVTKVSIDSSDKQYAKPISVADAESQLPKDEDENLTSDGNLGTTLACASEYVTPLSKLPYEEQLAQKQETSAKIFRTLCNKLRRLGINIPNINKQIDLLLPMLRPPRISHYRNKAEFTVDYAASKFSDEQVVNDRRLVVGFLCGKSSTKRRGTVLPFNDCQNLTTNATNIASAFECFINEFDLDPYSEQRRAGFWRTLTVRDFRSDCMIIVSVNQHMDEIQMSNNIIINIKTALVKRFISSPKNSMGTLTPLQFYCNSLYWCVQTGPTSDCTSRRYELLAGVPWVYEQLHGLRFRISPGTFFQTNTSGAELLYSTIAKNLLNQEQNQMANCHKELNKTEISIRQYTELLNTNEQEHKTDNCCTEEVEANSAIHLTTTDISCIPPSVKRAKLVDHLNDVVFMETIGNSSNEDPTPAQSSTVHGESHSLLILDICCGSGTIGQYLLKAFQQQQKLRQNYSEMLCVGVELVEEACIDAEKNAIANGFGKKCVYFVGTAEHIFRQLSKKNLPRIETWTAIENANIVGVLDPPRAGVSDKVIIACRNLEQMRSLVYVSCDPTLTQKNLVDLCKPVSKKFSGRPFRIVSVQPIDLFPQTAHFEWVVLLSR